MCDEPTIQSLDAGPDAGPDAKPDAGLDAKPDAGPDAELRRAVRRGLVAVVAVLATGWAGSRLAGGGPDAVGQRGVLHWRVPLDRAGPADLELLPGVGPTLALRVGRVCGGPATTRPRDLLRVPRLGPTGRQRIAPWVVFGGTEAVDTGRVAASRPVPGVVEGRAPAVAVAATR